MTDFSHLSMYDLFCMELESQCGDITHALLAYEGNADVDVSLESIIIFLIL